MKWIVRERFDGGAYLEAPPGLDAVEMSTQRAWLFESEEAARAAMEKATRGHGRETLAVEPMATGNEVERLREIEAQVLALYDNATATHRGDLGWYQYRRVRVRTVVMRSSR